MKRNTVLILGFLILILTIFTVCDKKPTEPQNDNPFDIENPTTGGKPFELSGKIANGGITLDWTRPDFEALQSYKIYRSENETNGYSEIGTANSNQTQYVDKQIENGHSYWYLVTVVNTKGNETSRTNVAAINIRTEPVLTINGGAEYTASREVSLTILAITAQQMIFSNTSDFAGASWETYTTSKNWTLPLGEGSKNVYMKVKYDSIESTVVQASILPQEVTFHSFYITDSDTSNTLSVQLNINAEFATKMMISNDSVFAGATWEDYAPTKTWHLDFSKAVDSKAKVFIKFMNDFDMESPVMDDEIFLAIVSGIQINNDAEYTTSREVILNLFSENANQMTISNISDFTGIAWETYAETKSWTLPSGDGANTVYAKFKNNSGLISQVYSDDIILDTTPPIIVLTVSPDSGVALETNFQFDPTGSNDNLTSSENLQMRFDWENDGSFDTNWQQLATATHQFTSAGNYTIKLQIKDESGLTSEDSLTVTVAVNTTNTGTVTDIDGNVYQTVKIGDQWWMAENLKVTKYRNGDDIDHITSNTEWTGLSTGAYCAYDNNAHIIVIDETVNVKITAGGNLQGVAFRSVAGIPGKGGIGGLIYCCIIR